VEERIRALLLRKVKGGGGNRREENEKKGKKRDLPDQCQTASYPLVYLQIIHTPPH